MENKSPRIFNGTYTIENKDGQHRTFRIRTQKKDAKFAPGKRVIALLSGADNTSDYVGFGFVDDSGVRVWSSKNTTLFQHYADLINVLVGNFDPARPKLDYGRYKVHMEGRCLCCNRKLTTPDSIKSGIGPKCAEFYMTGE